MGIDNNISGTFGITLLLVGWGSLLAWYNARVKKWRLARKTDDHSEESRKYIEALKSSANRAFLWTLGGIAGIWLVLDLIF